mmetsp:Transcript_33759/g.80743  ORF Transcript_33759/g.80743 Transcript_33759/m.80743 type:complete len:865 (-) Transcript_33759:279-2873(-)
MPALYLFNRRTLLAGDDLQLPSLSFGVVLGVQLFVFVPYLLYYTIELRLIDGDETNSGSGANLSYSWLPWSESAGLESAGRALYELDDYFEALDDLLPSMRTEACSTATDNFRHFLYPNMVLWNLAMVAIYCSLSLVNEKRIFQLSSLGTPTLTLHRVPLRATIEFKLTYLFGFNSVMLIYAFSYLTQFIGKYGACFPTAWWVVWFLLLTTQSVQFLLVLTTVISLCRAKPAQTDGTSGFYQRHIDSHNTHSNAEEAEEMWMNRCQGLCKTIALSTCFLFGGRDIVSHSAEGQAETFYGDVARALSDYFADFGTHNKRGLDVVPSDVGLGLVLLRHMQAQRKMLARREAMRQRSEHSSRPGNTSNTSNAVSLEADGQTNSALMFRSDNSPPSTTDLEDSVPTRSNSDEVYRPFSRTVLSPANNEDFSRIEEGARFARYQLAIYTWVLYYYKYPVSGTVRLIGRAMKEKSKCKPGVASDSSGQLYEHTPDMESNGTGANCEMSHRRIIGDNCIGIHESTLLAHGKIAPDDLAYASFGAGFYETPYCIIIDRKWKSIVLAIRGSLTLEDCVVDVLLEPSPLDALGERYGFDGDGQYCHGGVVECTMWLYEDLKNHRILETLMGEFPSYTLRVVGHSLGAGIGFILSLMLRSTIPSLRCLCYSPPGGLVTWDLAKECSGFVNSFVLDSDIVPRLSLDNMERLRDEVLHLISRVKLSKFEIAQQIMKREALDDMDTGDLDYILQQNEDMLYREDEIPESQFLQDLRQFETAQQERRASRGLKRSVALYPPGRITHLVKTGQRADCLHGTIGCITCGASNAGYEYTPIYKENDDFNEIEISATLWTDHFPNRVASELENVAREFGIDTS